MIFWNIIKPFPVGIIAQPPVEFRQLAGLERFFRIF
jgi:hypothetical protein